MVEIVRHFEVGLSLVTVPELLARLGRSIDACRQTLVTYANFHTMNVLNGDATAVSCFREFDLVLPDGIGVKCALRCWRRGGEDGEIYRHVEPWAPYLFEEAIRNGWSIYLLGSADGLAARSAERLVVTFPGLRIAGAHHGHLGGEEDSRAVVSAINDSGAKVLLVGMGQPLQERWIARWRGDLRTPVIVAVGGYFDKVSSTASAYPRWVYRTGMFWVYRFVNEPRRLWKRYTIGIATFAFRVVRARIAHGRTFGTGA